MRVAVEGIGSRYIFSQSLGTGCRALLVSWKDVGLRFRVRPWVTFGGLGFRNLLKVYGPWFSVWGLQFSLWGLMVGVWESYSHDGFG